MNRHIAVLAFLTGLAGCASSGTKVDPNAVAAFQKGRTTYAEAVAQLGPPTAVSLAPDGSRVAIYSYSRATTRAATFVPVVGLFAGGADVSGQSVALRFAANGTFLDFTSTQTQIGAHAGL